MKNQGGHRPRVAVARAETQRVETAAADSPRRNQIETKRKHASSDVVRLVEGIRELVSLQRALDGKPSHGRIERLSRQIERLQLQLANVVWHEFNGPGPPPWACE
jgi:hypothetical protein